jgi:hypothetical protein
MIDLASTLRIDCSLHLAAGPISSRNNKDFNSVINGFNDNGFDWINGFSNFNKQEQVIQIREESLKIVDNGRRREVVEQVQQVLIVDQVNSGFNKNLNNMFRKSNFNNRFQDRETVIIVVQEIQISVDDGRGNRFEESIFAQEIVVANRGRKSGKSQTVMGTHFLPQPLLPIPNAIRQSSKRKSLLPKRSLATMLMTISVISTALPVQPAR